MNSARCYSDGTHYIIHNYTFLHSTENLYEVKENFRENEKLSCRLEFEAFDDFRGNQLKQTDLISYLRIMYPTHYGLV